MAEYIEREALIDWLTKPTGFKTNCEDCTSIDCLDCIVGEAIRNAPAVDVVPVVRCSECVLSGNCTAEDTFRLVAGIENPFCCVGKRKDGEG